MNIEEFFGQMENEMRTCKETTFYMEQEKANALFWSNAIAATIYTLILVHMEAIAYETGNWAAILAVMIIAFLWHKSVVLSFVSLGQKIALHKSKIKDEVVGK